MNFDYDEDDRDAPLEEDLVEPDVEDQFLPCPSCGAMVFEDAEKCPRCGDWITPFSGGDRLHWVWLVAAVLAAAGMLVLTIF